MVTGKPHQGLLVCLFFNSAHCTNQMNYIWFHRSWLSINPAVICLIMIYLKNQLTGFIEHTNIYLFVCLFIHLLNLFAPHLTARRRWAIYNIKIKPHTHKSSIKIQSIKWKPNKPNCDLLCLTWVRFCYPVLFLIQVSNAINLIYNQLQQYGFPMWMYSFKGSACTNVDRPITWSRRRLHFKNLLQNRHKILYCITKIQNSIMYSQTWVAFFP